MPRVNSVKRDRRKRESRKSQERSTRTPGTRDTRQAAGLWRLLTAKIFVSLPLTLITALAILSRSNLWLAIWDGAQSRAWDGTGHSAIAQIYDHSIFPNTFGWTNAYFGGMPFPNFYPPVFYWCVAFIHHTHLLSLARAFKLMVAGPMLLMPVAMYLLGWFLSNRNRLVAAAVALSSVLLLIDLRFMGGLLAGLDYFSTFQIGLYTQPLGFILLIAWFIVYSSLGQRDPADETQSHPVRRRRRFAVSSLLLALTGLANFFNATTAIVLIVATIICDAAYYKRATSADEKREIRRVLLAHCLSPVVGMFLTLFWIIPLLNEYQYFVTRPYIAETSALFTPALIAWYAVALIGSVLWLRASIHADEFESSSVSKRTLWSYLTACAMLGAAVILASVSTPGWFPLQTPRFLATLTFMLALPVGYALAWGFRSLASLLDGLRDTAPDMNFTQTRYASSVSVVLFLLLALSAPGVSWAYSFYPAGARKKIDDVLDFARQHRDGRYLVEVINPKRGPAWTEASFDARAINSYLGSQGNETISGVFHEASPNSLFTLPVVNSFSNYPDSFGVSSMLADDLDFAAQPLSEHIKRAQFLGVKYLIIRTPAMKERVSKEITSAIRHDIGWWAVFELPGSPVPKIQALLYKPALVLSSFTVKARRRNEMSFIRLAEEQFADNWFDVFLARSEEVKLDRLTNLNDFGALIVDTYDNNDETAAYNLLRNYSQSHSLILLASDASLFQRIKAGQAEFPKLQIIERSAEDPGEVLEAAAPSYHYQSSSIRRQWQAVRRILEGNRETVDATSGIVNGRIEQGMISIDYGSGSQRKKVPVLISTTFHPNWRRDDREMIYGVAPFYMLTFVDHSVRLGFERQRLDRAALLISAATAVILGILAFSPSFRRSRTH
ncbi:MAG: hypothetical protein ACREBG_22400 [Pyrinomonadaceae bacterium]